MPAKPRHRDAIVDAAVTLFRERGYAATGLNDIVALSGAPKGSLYHYFPAGKASIAEAAVQEAGRRVNDTLSDLATKHATAGKLVRAWGDLLAGWMQESDFRAGSPVTTTLLETAPDDAAVTAAGREAFAAWRQTLSAKLTDQGVSAARADTLAGVVLAAMDGSLVQSRVACSADPIKTTAREMERLLDAETKKSEDNALAD